MSTKQIVLSIVVAALVVIGGSLAWHFISPLFIDIEVSEALPEEFVIAPTAAPSLAPLPAISTSPAALPTAIPQPIATATPTPVVAPIASGPQLTHAGDLERIDYNVEGTFQIIENDGSSLLRIEDLDITNGPDLFWVFSNSNQSFGNNDFEVIAPLRANQGSYNVPIPAHINPDDYRYVLIHCKRYSHTFAGGAL